MASKRELKKDVNFLTNEILMRGMIHLEFFGEENKDDIFAIINDAVAVRNDYIQRINQRQTNKSKAEVKTHYRAIYDDLLQSTHNLLERIDKLDISIK